MRCPSNQLGACNRKVPRGRGAEGADFQFGRLQVIQNRLAALEVDSARLREAECASVAVQKTDPEPLLHMRHVLADHRGGEVHALGRGDEGARLDYLAEHFDTGERVHPHSVPINPGLVCCRQPPPSAL